MHPTVLDRLAMRKRAVALGDLGLVRACDADLARLGVDPNAVPQVLETTERVETLERAVPEKPRRGRPPRPRCEHDMIVDRCPECSEEAA